MGWDGVLGGGNGKEGGVEYGILTRMNDAW